SGPEIRRGERCTPAGRSARWRMAWASMGVLIVASVTAGCTSDHHRNDSEVPATFAAKAAAVCAAATERKVKQGPFPYPNFNPTDPDWERYPGVADYLATAAPLFRIWERQMAALGPPSSGREAWNNLLHAIHRHVALAEEQQLAAVHHDSATFANDF